MQCPIHQQAEERPGDLAVWTPGLTWTYAEMDAAVAGMARRFRREGVGEGDRVALRMGRSAEMIAALWALWRLGAVAAPLSTRLPPAAVNEAVKRVGAAAMITSEDAVRDALPPEVIRLDASLSNPESLPGESAAGERAVVDPSRDATLVFTSGSTGPPKAALHRLENHLASARGSNANIPVGAGDRWLLSLPLYHVGGLAILVRCALGGGAVAVPDPSAALAKALDAAEATHLSLVATQCRRLLQAEAWALPERVQAILLGGSAIPDAVLTEAHDRGWPIHTSYGCTEMASQVTTTPPGASLDTLRTSGRLLPHRRLRIDSTEERGDGGTGEILLAGDTLFRGYVTGDATANDGDDDVRDPRDDGGWYRSGDLGRIDAAGRLRVVGRVDRMFVSGGENVQPEEIETALEKVEGVARAVVVAVPDDEYGQRPVAFVDAAEHRPGDWEEILTKNLPRFKIPDAFHPLPGQAVESGMKVNRSLLEDEARKLQNNHV